jgi:hypothetical protein
MLIESFNPSWVFVMRIVILLIVLLVLVPSATAYQFSSQIPGGVCARPVSLSANKKPLIDCLREICKQANVQLEVDRVALSETKLSLDKPLTVSFDDAGLCDAAGKLIPHTDFPEVLQRFRDDKLILTSHTAFLKLIPAWLEAHAALDDEDQVYIVYVQDKDDDRFMTRLATLPGLREVRLGNAKGLTLAGLEALAKCQSLTTVTMYGAGRPENPKSIWTSDDALLALSKIETLQHLKADDCGISDAGLEHLASLKQLTTLSLRQNQIKGPGLKWLAGLTQLKSLDFGCHVSSATYGKNEIADKHIKDIEGLQQLEYLGTEGLNVTASKLNFPQLRSLTLGSAFREKMLENEALGNLMKYRNLRHLTVTSDAVTDAGIALISNLQTLKSLKLHCGSVTDAGIATLTRLPLTHLQLRNVELTDAGLRHISTIRTLERIDISGGMDQTTVAGFQQFKSLPELHTIGLTGLRGKRDYQGFGELKQLRSLDFLAADIANWTQTDLDRLAESLPNATVTLSTGAGYYSPTNSQQGGWRLRIP